MQPRLKQHVASYHTTEVIAHREPKNGCHGMVWAISTFCQLTTQTPSISNRLGFFCHTKPVMAILVLNWLPWQRPLDV